MIMNGKGFGKKLSWPNLIYYAGRPAGLRKTTESSVRIADLRAEI
jgi:hypothetical protein